MTQIAKRSRFLILVAAAGWLYFAESLYAQPGRPTVVVHVYNNAGAEPPVLAEISGYVQEMLARIGVDMIWVDETARLHGVNGQSVEHSLADHSAAHVSLAIVPNVERVAPYLTKDEMAMGWTPAGQSERAYVFYGRIEQLVLKNAFRVPGLRTPRIAAYAVEHELGHLLIPPLANAHSDKGIMKATLTPGDFVAFRETGGFSRKQGEFMREEIQRRILKAAH